MQDSAQAEPVSNPEDLENKDDGEMAGDKGNVEE
jgi:hypothetical protein